MKTAQYKCDIIVGKSRKEIYSTTSDKTDFPKYVALRCQ